MLIINSLSDIIFVVLRIKLTRFDGKFDLLILLLDELLGGLLSDILGFEYFEGRAERLSLLLSMALQVLKEFSITLLHDETSLIVAGGAVNGAQAHRLVEVGLALPIFVTLVRHVYLNILIRVDCIDGVFVLDPSTDPEVINIRGCCCIICSLLCCLVLVNWICKLVDKSVGGTVTLAIIHFRRGCALRQQGHRVSLVWLCVF